MASIFVGNDGANTVQGGSGRDLIYGYDPNGAGANVTSIQATTVATGFTQPVFAGAPAGDLGRLFVVEKNGLIKLLDLDTGQTAATPFLDLTAQVSTVLILGEGNDIGFGGDGQDYLFGDAGNDVLSGDAGVDVFIAGAGDDYMNGGTESDFFYGEAGNDIGIGGDGNDIFVMAEGNDTANGDAGQDYFYMGAGDDTINGGAGVDVMLGEAGNDTFNAGLGVDYLFLGPGGAGDNDTVIVDAVNTGVQVVNNFEAGGTNDSFRLVGTGMTSFTQVQAAMTNFGSFTVLSIDGDTSVWIIGATPAQLTAADFVFA